MSFLEDYPPLQIIQDLARRRKISVYLVGGFLRDHLLGILKTDFDFAVEKNALRLARQFASSIGGAYVVLDKERGCARVVHKRKGKVYTFDFADFRAQTLRGDLARRDFTLNTLSVDLSVLESAEGFAQAAVDYKNALRDIRQKKIRMVSATAFRDDPLRMMRAFSLRAVLGFHIERGTLTRIKKDKDLITRVSYERVRDELFKILSSDRAAETLKAMDAAGLLEKVIPQLGVMRRCRQGGYHHLDVWPHSLETVVQLEDVLRRMRTDAEVTAHVNEALGGERSRGALLKLAALLHDIGKPDTRKKEDDRLTFHGHEHVGKRIVSAIARMLKLSTRERHILEDIVLWHLRPGYLSNFNIPGEKAVYRYFRDTGAEAVSILLLSLADQRATRGPLTTPQDQRHHEKICLGLIRRYFDKKKEKPLARLISGDDLIRHLRLQPSPLFGEILARVFEKQALGKIQTKDEALKLARQIARGKRQK